MNDKLAVPREDGRQFQKIAWDSDGVMQLGEICSDASRKLGSGTGATEALSENGQKI